MDSKNEAKTARALRRVSCGEGNACFFSVLDKGGEMPPTSLRRQKPDPKDSFCLALVRGREGRARLWVGSAKKTGYTKTICDKKNQQTFVHKTVRGLSTHHRPGVRARSGADDARDGGRNSSPNGVFRRVSGRPDVNSPGPGRLRWHDIQKALSMLRSGARSSTGRLAAYACRDFLLRHPQGGYALGIIRRTGLPASPTWVPSPHRDLRIGARLGAATEHAAGRVAQDDLAAPVAGRVVGDLHLVPK